MPPGTFVANAVDGAMMAAAERHRELIADLTAERPRLHEAQMMGVAGRAAADQAGLRSHEPQVLLVAVAARFGDGKRALVDAHGAI